MFCLVSNVRDLVHPLNFLMIYLYLCPVQFDRQRNAIFVRSNAIFCLRVLHSNKVLLRMRVALYEYLVGSSGLFHHFTISARDLRVLVSSLYDQLKKAGPRDSANHIQIKSRILAGDYCLDYVERTCLLNISIDRLQCH